MSSQRANLGQAGGVLRRLQAVVCLAFGASAARAQLPAWDAAPLSRSRELRATASADDNTDLILRLLSSDPSCALPILRPSFWRACWVDGDTASAARLVAWVRPEMSLWLNSGRESRDLDGAVWQGRGLTVAATGGARIRWSVLDVSLRPLAFVADNLPYTPTVGTVVPGSFVNPVFNPVLDAPYRFGSGTYERIDAGESWVRVGWRGASAGFSTSPQVWGPAHLYPLMLNAEAGGYPRLFIGGSDMPVGIGRVTAQYSLGRLESSAQHQLAPGARSRIAPAMIAAFTPAGMRGLTVGGTRMFHVRWKPGVVGMRTAALPFKGFLKISNWELTADHNQLVTIFARVAPPGAGVEVYGEFFREDHNHDMRDLVGEPDHISAYTLGLRRAWRSKAAVRSLTWEAGNGRLSHLTTVRAQGPVYRHGIVSEGHTQLGQVLGSAAMPGGGGTTAIFQHVADSASWLVRAEVRRTAQRESGYFDPLASTGWDLRQTGYFDVRASKMVTRGARSNGLSMGVQRGFGVDRITNVTLHLTWQP
jgi:hypothetical protein